jgi:large subunit ribosomal protein L2
LRYKTTNTFEQLSTSTPHRPLVVSRGKRQSGRNNAGRITVRHRGGGHRRHYRIVDFRRDKFNIPGVVEHIEYDPNRTCFIALVKYADGERRYMLATLNMKPGVKVLSADACDIADGNHIQMRNVPLGMMIHNVEMVPGRGGQMVRTAGAYAEVVAKENNMVQLRLPSGEVRNVPEVCRATLGQVSNAEHMNVVIGSAGRKRWKGWRPTVRGMAMNPVDHPMGGGEGRSKSGGGRQHPMSPWGQPSKGFKTRKPKKQSSKLIVKRRNKK